MVAFTLDGHPIMKETKIGDVKYVHSSIVLHVCVFVGASTKVSSVVRPNDFPFQYWPISVSHFNKFRLTANFYRFHCLLVVFHIKIMLVLYGMGLFFNSTICGVTFDSRD